MPKRLALLSIAVLLVVTSWVGGCASVPLGSKITKVKYYHLKDGDSESLSVDPMIRFEREHLLHGAVTEADKQDRFGHYYALFWYARPVVSPVTVRFEYRQIGTGEEVFRMERVVSKVRERNTTLLGVTGESYQRHGRVVAWRASIWHEDKELDASYSFLWK